MNNTRPSNNIYLKLHVICHNVTCVTMVIKRIAGYLENRKDIVSYNHDNHESCQVILMT